MMQLFLFTFQTTQFLLQHAICASKVLTLNLLLATKIVGIAVAAMIWKSTEKLRKKLFVEFMMWILNPNAVALFIFWPGWIVLLGLWYLSQCFG